MTDGELKSFTVGQSIKVQVWDIVFLKSLVKHDLKIVNWVQRPTKSCLVDLIKMVITWDILYLIKVLSLIFTGRY